MYYCVQDKACEDVEYRVQSASSSSSCESTDDEEEEEKRKQHAVKEKEKVSTFRERAGCIRRWFV